VSPQQGAHSPRSLQSEHAVAHWAIASDVRAAGESIGAPRRGGLGRAEVLIVIMLSSQATAQVGIS
jgi:hypothetical protein